LRVEGETAGLKSRDRKVLERLSQRRLPPAALLTQEFARQLAGISRAIRRQVGALIDRRGTIAWVGVGDAHRIELPDLKRQRVAGRRLRGLRFVHTHLADEPLTRDDLTDLVLLRLDLMAAVTVGEDGLPGVVHAAHLRPPGRQGSAAGSLGGGLPAGAAARGDGPSGADEETPWELLPPVPPSQLDLDCTVLLADLERAFARFAPERPGRRFSGRAILVGVGERMLPLGDVMDELAELARDAGLEVVDSVVQRRARLDPRTLVGRGKLEGLVIRALDRGADLMLFACDLSPSQARNISHATDLKVLDRTQLILDIFARRATTREGKLQVELAQLRYRLPRLVQRDTSLSRLGGGIGGRGPGETRLEVDRRRVRERIGRLQRDLARVAVKRDVRRKRRETRGLPVVSLVGYTNAGKSTLLNRLTRSEVAAGNRMFETLDPTNRRLRVPVEREVLLADTVGFIHDLPEDLIEAFRGTLEEISAASLLLQVVDASSARLDSRAAAVEGLLAALGFQDIPRIVLLNKVDRIDEAARAALPQRLAGADTWHVSGITGEGLEDLVAEIARLIPTKPVGVPPLPARPAPREDPLPLR
jgi:GTP-binding protein HflX